MTDRRFTVTLVAAIATLIITAAASPALAMYNPQVGRFLQRDPIGYPDGMNTYAGYHVMHQAVDPSGLESANSSGSATEDCSCENDQPTVQDDAGRYCC